MTLYITLSLSKLSLSLTDKNELIFFILKIQYFQSSNHFPFYYRFGDLGGTDDFPTEMLEWRLGCGGVIDYSGNLSEPPVAGKPKANLLGPKSKKIIRGRDYDEDSDSDLD